MLRIRTRNTTKHTTLGICIHTFRLLNSIYISFQVAPPWPTDPSDVLPSCVGQKLIPTSGMGPACAWCFCGTSAYPGLLLPFVVLFIHWPRSWWEHTSPWWGCWPVTPVARSFPLFQKSLCNPLLVVEFCWWLPYILVWSVWGKGLVEFWAPQSITDCLSQTHRVYSLFPILPFVVVEVFLPLERNVITLTIFESKSNRQSISS